MTRGNMARYITIIIIIIFYYIIIIIISLSLSRSLTLSLFLTLTLSLCSYLSYFLFFPIFICHYFYLNIAPMTGLTLYIKPVYTAQKLRKLIYEKYSS